MKGDDAHQWQDAARAEMQNFERHGVYVEVSEDQLPPWNNSTRRAHEVIDMMWVLRIKKTGTGDLLKYKARAVVYGNQQKRKQPLWDLAEHTLETFAPAARSATFKLRYFVQSAA
eukprot:2686228-Pleurochrysis_carterae.AAC.1